MAELIKRNKALSVRPLKSSQPVGASLAFMGLHRAVPRREPAEQRKVIDRDRQKPVQQEKRGLNP